MKRFLFDVLLLFFVFLTPWWVTIILAIIGLFVFKNFYEFLVSSVVMHLLSTAKDSFGFNNTLVVYLIIIVFYMFVQYLRNHIILYKNEIPYKS